MNKFWKTVSINYSYKQMDLAVSALLYSIARKETSSQSEAVVLIKNIQNNLSFQNKVFLQLYYSCPKNRETFRTLLGEMCGSYSLGNPVADYIFQKYTNDPNIQKVVASNIAERKKQEQLAIQKEAANLKQEELKQDSTTQEGIEYDADFPGGIGAFYRFIQKNFKMPENLDSKGTVIVEFSIDTTGKVSNAKIISEPMNPDVESETLRVINLSPLWNPAKKNDVPVIATMRLPIDF